MSQVAFDEVVKMAEQLTPQEQSALIAHLVELSRFRRLTKEERKALFAAMSIDLGAASPDVSVRREDWYDDDGR